MSWDCESSFEETPAFCAKGSRGSEIFPDDAVKEFPAVKTYPIEKGVCYVADVWTVSAMMQNCRDEADIP
jgi:hypothetical protein